MKSSLRDRLTRMGWRGTHQGYINIFWDPWNGASGKGWWGWGITTEIRLRTIGVATGNLCQFCMEVLLFRIHLRGIWIQTEQGAAIVRGCGGWGDFLSLLDCDHSGTYFTIIEKVTGPVPDKGCQSIFLTLSPVIQKSEHLQLVNLGWICPGKVFWITFV